MSLLGDGLALVLGHLVVLDVLDLLAVLAVRPGQVDGLSRKAEFLKNGFIIDLQLVTYIYWVRLLGLDSNIIQVLSLILVLSQNIHSF